MNERKRRENERKTQANDANTEDGRKSVGATNMLARDAGWKW